MKKKLQHFFDFQYIFYVLLSLLFIFVAFRSIKDPFLWYDEAGQFYISKGLYHYADPYAAYSGLSDVIHYNRYYNLDPGGFSVILHYWSMISNSSYCLRLLPFLFYLCALFFLFKIGKILFKDTFRSLLLVSLFLYEFVFYAGELRAYSMEFCGISLSSYLMLCYYKNLSFRNLMILACCLVFFMTSRYGFIIYSACMAITIFIYGVNRNITFKFARNYLIFGVVLLTGVACIYLITMQYQNANAKDIGYVPYIGKNPYLMRDSWMSIRFYVILFYIVYNYYKNKVINPIIVLSTIVCSVFFVFSVMDLYPWDFNRTISVSIIQYIALGVMALDACKVKESLIIPFGAFLLYFTHISTTVPYLHVVPEHRERYNEFISLIGKLKGNESVFVDRFMAPEVKYAFEEGELKKLGKTIYEDHLYLAKGYSHNFNGGKLTVDVKTADDVEADYYILVPWNQEKKIKDMNDYTLLEGYKHIYKKVKHK